MEFLDIDNYENLLQITKLNKEMQLLAIEINDFENKKKSNIHFLNIQKEFYNDMINKKINLLKKYNFIIIKNIINMYNINKKNINFDAEIKNNFDLIKSYNNILNTFSIDNYENKTKTINKLLFKCNNLLKQTDYNILLNNLLLDNISLEKYFNNLFINSDSNSDSNINIKNLLSLDNKFLNNYMNYFCIFYTFSDTNYINNSVKSIYKQSILKKKINIECKEFFKFKTSINKKINKIIISNKKINLFILKNEKQINLLYKKSKDLKNKYLYTLKDIKIQENKNNKLQSTMNANIHELNIRIGIKKKMLIDYQNIIEKHNNNLLLLNNTKGHEIDNGDLCSICLESLHLGVTTNCKHNFHYGCINLYIFNIIQNNNNLEFKCPICRQFI